MLWILRMLLAAAVLGTVVYLWRRFGPRGPSRRPAIPAAWRGVAREDERLRQALELRARVAALAGRPQSLVDDALVAEFDHVLEPLVALAALRIELDTHLAGLDPEAAARDAATLAPQRAARLEAAYRGLVDRRDRLVSESSEIVTGLREIYLDVLDGATGTSGEIQHAAARTRALGESVRLRVDAEREVRELIAAD